MLSPKDSSLQFKSLITPRANNLLLLEKQEEPYIQCSNISDTAQQLCSLCRFGVPLIHALRFVMSESSEEDILEKFVLCVSPTVVQVMTIYDNKKDCQPLLAPVLTKMEVETQAMIKLRLWLEMSISKLYPQRRNTMGPQEQSLQHSLSDGSTTPKHPLQSSSGSISKKSHFITYKHSNFNPKNKKRSSSAGSEVFNTKYAYVEKKYDLSKDEQNGLICLQARIRGICIRKEFIIRNIKQRKQCLQEMLEGEEILHNNMVLMDKYFRQPLLVTHKDKHFKRKVASIFLTLTRCITSSSIFVEKLKEVVDRFNYVTCVGDTFHVLIAYIAPYLNFTTDYQISLTQWKELKKSSTIQKILKQNASVLELENISLESLLIQPVQRVMKYPMLIKEMIKYTNKEHPDNAILKEAFHEFQLFSTIANERSKMRDSLKEVATELKDEELVIDNRYHLWTGVINSKVPTKAYLFNDMVLVCSKQLKSKTWDVIESMQLGGDIDIFFRHAKPMVLELENEEVCLQVKKQIVEIIRDEWFNLNDERSWLDLLDRSMTGATCE
ncbi:Rho guanine nucleotide exchange factor [Entamoeba marina]